MSRRRRQRPVPVPSVIRYQTIGPRPQFGGRTLRPGRRAPALPETRCPTSGKRQFLTEEAAETQATEWAYQNSSEYRAYLCSCGSWHLSRQR